MCVYTRSRYSISFRSVCIDDQSLFNIFQLGFLMQAAQCRHHAERHGMGCACGPHHDAAGSPRSHARPRVPTGWGLPTAMCPASTFLTDEFPALHRRWLRDDRVLYHCPDASGLGDFMRGIPSSFLLSILLELAFVIDCDLVQWSRGRQVRTNAFVKRFFVGPHFDWRYSGKARVPCSPAGTPWRLKSNLMHNHVARAPNSTRVLVKPSVSARRFVRINEHKLAPLLGAFYVNASHDTTEGCLLRYLLAPSPRLHELTLDRANYAHPGPLPASWLSTMGNGQRLIPAVTMHVRVGDHTFFRNASAVEEAAKSRAWKEFLNETRETPFSSGHAGRAMQCLAVASATWRES